MAAITSIVSLNQLVTWFEAFADNHFFLKDFGFGEPYDIGTTRQMEFPYMWLTLDDTSVIATGTNIKSAIPDYSFRVFFMDKINIQENYLDANGFQSDNSQEIISDTIQYLQDLITYIGGLDKHSPITYKTKANAKWNKYNKYASKEPLAYYSNGYIYITGYANPGLKWINIEGVFANPRAVHNYKNPDGTPCYNPDTDNYPLSGRMVDAIMDLIKTKELNMFMQIVEDSTNNASNKS